MSIVRGIEGVHLVRYDVPPVFWRAEDLELLMALAYRLLLPNEPRWREAGATVRRRVGEMKEPRRLRSPVQH